MIGILQKNKALFQKIKKNNLTILQIILFIITAALIIYLLPRKSTFKHEFQKGSPWMHEVLIAPFNFPIYKPQVEYQKEADSILQSHRPYFIFDTTVRPKKTEEFKDFFLTKQEEVLHAKELHYSDIIKTIVVDELEKYYQQGIVGMKDILSYPAENAFFSVYIKEGEHFVLRNVKSEKETYKALVENLLANQQLADLPGNRRKKIINSLNLNHFISPNLIYDETTTKKVLESKQQEVSMTRGMVQANQRIISKGELVTQEKELILDSLKKAYESKIDSSESWVFAGQSIIVSISLLLLYLFFRSFRNNILNSLVRTSFILFLILFNVLITSALFHLTNVPFYVFPIIVQPMIIRTFYDTRLALFIHMITIFILAFIAPSPFEFVFLNFTAGITAILSLTNQYRRGRFFFSAILVIITYSLVYFAMSIIQVGNISNINYHNFLFFSINGMLLLSALPLIYLFEKIFGFLSDATLIELADTNNLLLRKLAEMAPGTFQHSLQVANLGEDAARTIGANSLLVRTGAMYHDIGKTDNPTFFIENQDLQNNPHDNLEFDESAEIIIGHVKKGVQIARKHKLPYPIIEFIRTHHGTTTVQYFYKNYIKKYPDEDIDIAKFSYPGPKPQTKEAAIMMMADSVEAASRSLSSYSVKELNELVNYIIDYQVDASQFDDADITFKDISMIKEIFKLKLKTIYHSRISYPK